MRRITTSTLLWVLVTLVLLQWASAAGIPALDLEQLIGSADIIVAGRIQSCRQIGETTIDISGHKISAKQMAGEIPASTLLKGDSTTSVLPLRFVIPVSPAGGIGYPEIDEGSFRIFFLKRSEEGYGFANPYYPSLPAIPNTPVTGNTPLDRVASQLGTVVESPQLPTSDKVDLLVKLQKFDAPALHKALVNSLGSIDRTLQLAVAGALLQRNDVAALEIAEEAFLHPPSDMPSYIPQDLASSIARGLKDPRAVPALDQILSRAPDAEARRSAAFALRNTGSRSAIKPLARALGDSDREVRYYAVVGLAEITGQSEWRPLLQDYQSQEHHYLSHWQEWAESQSH